MNLRSFNIGVVTGKRVLRGERILHLQKAHFLSITSALKLFTLSEKFRSSCETIRTFKTR